MEQLYSELKKVMTAERDYYAGLLALSEKKKEILIKNDVNGLNRIVRQETDYLRAMKPIAGEREMILKMIARQSGLGEIGMDDIISMAEGSDAEELENLQHEFKKVLKSLADLNDLNKTLIQTQLQYTAFCIEILTNRSGTGDTYNNTGTFEENKKRFGLIDQRV